MPIKRLTVRRRASEGGRVLPDVPAPAGLEAGSCGLVRALMAAIQHAGVPVGYDALMGLSGIAFMLTMPDGPTDLRTSDLTASRVLEGIRAVGLGANAQVFEAGSKPVADLVQGAVDAGRAVALLGWPNDGDDWSVITGYDPSRGIICGWPAHYRADSYLGAEPGGSAALLLQAGAEPTQQPQAVRQALAWALQQAPRVAETYEQWATSLEGEWGTDPEDPEMLRAVGAHEALCERLTDGRLSAARFLGHCVDMFSAVCSPWLAKAAQAYQAAAETLEARQPPVHDDRILQALVSPEWRQEWALTLQTVASHDAEAADCLRRFLKGDPLPAGGDGWVP